MSKTSLISIVLFVLAATSSISFSQNTGLTVGRLQCEDRDHPLGVDRVHPSLAWIVQSDVRGARQSAYRVLAGSSSQSLAHDQGDLWDSGKINSDQTTGIEYLGKTIGCGQQVFWKVMAWNEAGHPSAWSEPANWTMGAQDAADWQEAKWIGAPQAAATSPSSPEYATLLLRDEFTVKPGLTRAVALVCGLGYCETTINGARVTEDVLSPGWSKYDKTCLYDTYDVTKSLHEGSNAIGLFLGNGMYNVKKVGDRYVKFQGSFGPQKAIAQLRLEYSDGTREIVGTDQRWKVASGPVTFSSVYGGEDYDARLNQQGWDQAGFEANSWASASVTTGPGGELRGLSCAAPPIRRFELFKPIKTTAIKPGISVYDMGQNASQMMTITVEGPAGSSVRIRPSELIKPDGTVDQQSTGRPIYCSYILSGNGEGDMVAEIFLLGIPVSSDRTKPGSRAARRFRWSIRCKATR